jgi:hypothetical protein
MRLLIILVVIALLIIWDFNQNGGVYTYQVADALSHALRAVADFIDRTVHPNQGVPS